MGVGGTSEPTGAGNRDGSLAKTTEPREVCSKGEAWRLRVGKWVRKRVQGMQNRQK